MVSRHVDVLAVQLRIKQAAEELVSLNDEPGLVVLTKLAIDVDQLETHQVPIPLGILDIAEKIMADPHRYDHVVKFATGGWVIKHPVQERLDPAAIWDCPFAFGDLGREVHAEWENDANCAGLYRLWNAGEHGVGLELIEAHPEWEDSADGV
jgi:hypothetical protein